MKTLLLVLGTRPAAIKLAPVALELLKHEGYRPLICNTEQQKELSNQTLSFFGLRADISLDVMQPNQSLPTLQAHILSKLTEVYQTHHIDATIVQGDTMTAFCGALASFYHKVPVFHLEAGLRSYDLFEPFPEEGMRQMVARVSDLHFAPTCAAKEALLKENIEASKIFITGNTVIDALFCLTEEVLEKASQQLSHMGIDLASPLILITAHRRENHGERLERILEAIVELASLYPEHQFVLPVHPNPNVKQRVDQVLENKPNIKLTAPLDYPLLVCLMRAAKLVLTDSGGIQEEAPSFGVPVLVMRYETERKEGIEAGLAQLVGADTALNIEQSHYHLSQENTTPKPTHNPYGDGQSAVSICQIMDAYWKD